jgi:hypothetical protein
VYLRYNATIKLTSENVRPSQIIELQLSKAEILKSQSPSVFTVSRHYKADF